MMAIFRRQMVRYRGQIIGWSIGLVLLALMLISFYGTVQEQGEQLQQLVESYPPEMMAFFGGDFDDFTTPAGYLSAELFSFMMPLTVGIFVILAGSGLIVSDEENGTLDLIAAQPISRSALFGGRLLAFVTATSVILLITWLALSIGAVATDFPATWIELLYPFLSLFGLVLLYGTLALLLSMVLPSRRLAAMTAGIILIVSYFIHSLANINEDLEAAADLMPFAYYQSGEAMLGLNVGWLVGLLAVSALFAGLAWWRFEQRDIRVAGEGGWRLPRPWRRATT